jgi:hypothetical protein
MELTITCSQCGSGVCVYPTESAKLAECDICKHHTKVAFDQSHLENCLESCPVCGEKKFYAQKDFNRKIGVILFVIAAILSIWTYGISFIILYGVDFFLFRRLATIAVCYHCDTIFRKVKNIAQISEFDHETNDRIVYGEQKVQESARAKL